MKPKLIILNGPLGIGKSTIAEKYANEHPITLKLDIDQVWMLISHWREHNNESAPIAKRMAVEMTRVHLQSGHDVIIPQIYRKESYLEELEAVAKGCDAGFYEILLAVPKTVAVQRFIERGQRQGNPDGFRPGGIISRGGGVNKLEQMYDEMMAVVSRRPKTIKLEPVLDDVDATYSKLIDIVEHR